MNDRIIVKSSTYAQKAKKLLQQANINSYIYKIADSIHCCAWCVKIDESLYKKSLRILTEGNVKIIKDSDGYADNE